MDRWLAGWVSCLVLSPDDLFDAVFSEGGFLELRTPASVAGWIDVFVLERVRDIAGDVDTGDLAPPEEVPVLFDLERFVPADCLQDVAIGDEAIADVVTPADRALATIVTVGNPQSFSVGLHELGPLLIVR